MRRKNYFFGDTATPNEVEEYRCKKIPAKRVTSIISGGRKCFKERNLLDLRHASHARMDPAHTNIVKFPTKYDIRRMDFDAAFRQNRFSPKDCVEKMSCFLRNKYFLKAKRSNRK
jgi:hypothetical protein